MSCFAGSFWVPGTSAEAFQEMCACFLKVLKAYNWRVPLEEGSWCCTMPGEAARSNAIDGQVVLKRNHFSDCSSLGGLQQA